MHVRCLGLIALTGALFVTAAFADDSAERAKLTGAWKLQGGNGADHTVWTLDVQGDVFRVSSAQGGKTIAEFTCSPAKECETKDGGHKVKVLMYFNGPKLVMQETKGDEIFKRRFGAGEHPDTLDLEFIPVTPGGKTEMLHFQRVSDAEAKVH
jgi:hypothetical protein